MAENFQKNRLYDYKANSNLVLEADKDNKRIRNDEGTGEVESLHGKLVGVRMGDRINYSSKPELSTHVEKLSSAKRPRGDAVDDEPMRKKSVLSSHGNANIVEQTDDLDAVNYHPKTRESRIAYEELLNFIMSSLGDQPQDILRGAADEIIAILKDNSMKDYDRQREVEKLLSKQSSEKFHKLVNIGKQIKDFNVDVLADDDNDKNTMDEDLGVAVVFEEDDDNEGLGGLTDGFVDEIAVHRGKRNVDDDDSDSDGDSGDEAVGSGNMLRGGDKDNDVVINDKLFISPHDIDAHWLQRQLSKYYDDANVSSKLAEDTLNILHSTDQRACENNLVMLLDFDKFDFIKLLLSNRTKVYYCTRLKQAQNEDERKNIEEEMRAESTSTGATALLEELSATSSAENWTKDRIGEFADKARREARALTTDSKTAASDVVEEEGGYTQRKEDVRSRIAEKNLDLDGLSFQQGSHLMSNARCELPEKSWRATKKGYEEVHVPAVRPVIPPGERLIEVSELPEWMGPTFNGVRTLNRIQSKMVDTALYNTENVLLCAPTGAGKTNVALLTMLNTIAQYRDDITGKIDLDGFKIVYIAPMKALVQEVVQSFGKRLAPLNINVRELSGDQNLSRQEIVDTQLIVTTPEKWDIITRKAGDRTYTQLVKLMIIDEIHLLHDDRGPVLEALVARTIRQVETTQELIRMVGLSATLPNFEDVATFLRVKPDKGLFFFDSSFRPVPLQQQYIGVTEKKALKRFQVMNEICYEKALQHAGRNQILIFVHSRAETIKTARALRDMALENDALNQFVRDDSASKEILREESELSAKNPDLKDLLKDGFGIHHAGLVRSDRTLVEDLFGDKHVQVLVCTATLAWGVNLPAHTVIIKGTQMYSPQEGKWVELSPLDIMQMMGRAGRYGLDSEGEGIIITAHSELQYYLSLMNQQLPIESQFIKKLPDMLNAEIVLGAVQTVKEAAAWLGYTYLYVRMLRNPHLYGCNEADLAGDGDSVLLQRRRDLVHSAAVILDKHGLIKYDRKTGFFHVTVMGRVASHYYVSHDSISVFNDYLKPTMNDIEIFRLFSLSGEFKQIHVREEEKLELNKLVPRVPIPIKESIDEPSAKVNVLLQAYISRLKLDGFALIADMTYIQQSACRLMRALFEVALKKGWAALANKTLHICKMVERKIWGSQSPLRQFNTIPEIIIRKLEKNSDILWDRYYDLKPQDLGEMVKIPKMGKTLHKYVHMFPKLSLDVHVLPITRGLLKVMLTITPDFQYDTNVHEAAQLFWILIEDGDGETVLHYEPFILRGQYCTIDHIVDFVVPLSDPLPPQYFIKVISDRWMHSDVTIPVSFKHLILPSKYPPCTELLDLQPLPTSVVKVVRDKNDLLKTPLYETLYRDSEYGVVVEQFNPIQTQSFSSLYETDENVLICAPSGSGKTVCAEFAILRLFAKEPNGKCVYFASKDDLVMPMYEYFKMRFGGKPFALKVVMLTGDSASDLKLLESGNIVVTCCVHWDIISRRWKQRKHVQNISLYIADELHVIGGNEGPVLEVVLSRVRFMSSQLEKVKSARIVALSSCLANAKDVAEWLGVSQSCLFNYSTSTRPVPLELHFHGFDTNHLGNRMLSMAKPTFDAVSCRCVSVLGTAEGPVSYCKPALVFVPSRKQCQLTAIDMITYAIATGQQHKFLNLKNHHDLRNLLIAEEGGCIIKDSALVEALQHGVGYVHKGMNASDMNTVLSLYCDGIISVLVVPFNMCWTLPPAVAAYLVVVMDTVYYDGREHRYADYPIADVMQMVGLAAFVCPNSLESYQAKVLNSKRSLSLHMPMYTLPDSVQVIHPVHLVNNFVCDGSIAVILCHSPKKEYLKRLLHDPLPVESHLNHYLHDHLNAEIVTKTIENKQDAVDYMTWLFLYRRLVQNPNYYNLDGTTHRHLSDYLSELVENVIGNLAESKCIEVDEVSEIDLSPCNLGMIASYYYISYTTVELYGASVTAKSKIRGLMEILAASTEFGVISMRQNEDNQLQRLSKHLPLALPNEAKYDEVSTKVNILLQSYFSRFPLPADLMHDLNAVVLKHACKLLLALVDVISSEGWLKPALAAMELSQMVVQGMWDKDPILLQLPHFNKDILTRLEEFSQRAELESPISTVFDIIDMDDEDRDACLQLSPDQMSEVAAFCNNYPNIDMTYSVNDSVAYGSNSEDNDNVAPVEVLAGDAVTVAFLLQREGGDDEVQDKKLKVDRFVYSSRFPGAASSATHESCPKKVEGWWLVVGDRNRNSLLTVKRVNIGEVTKVRY